MGRMASAEVTKTMKHIKVLSDSKRLSKAAQAR